MPVGARVAALTAVVDYRLHWVGDSTRFDVCSVQSMLAGNVGGELPDLVQGLLTEGCNAQAPGPESSVHVDSMTLSGDSLARVYLTVRKGEHRYFEDYAVYTPCRGGRVGWVRDIRIWGIVREYRRRNTTAAPR